MEQYAIGFWGCYFGATALMLAGAAFAFVRSLRRVAVNAAFSAIASAFFVVAFLGGLPIQDEATLARLLAQVACIVSALLAYLLFSLLGLLRPPRRRRLVRWALAAAAAGGAAAGWLLTPTLALALGLVMAFLMGMVALVLCLRNARRGDSLAWAAVAGVLFMLIAITGLGWIALDRAHAPWQVHAMSALAGTAYLAAMASVLWTRYSYLIELRQAMAYGPSYDPVTRMRSLSETGSMVGAAFKRYRNDAVPMGVIVVSIGNLYALEKLYGLEAANNALFVCASRLRRAIPAHVEVGRLAHDGFLLLVPNSQDSAPLIRLTRAVQERMSPSIVLNTRAEGAAQAEQQTRWLADIGVGVLRVSRADARAATAVAMGRGMSRTAVSYPSRIAWYDEASGEIVAVPAAASAEAY